MQILFCFQKDILSAECYPAEMPVPCVCSPFASLWCFWTLLWTSSLLYSLPEQDGICQLDLTSSAAWTLLRLWPKRFPWPSVSASVLPNQAGLNFCLRGLCEACTIHLCTHPLFLDEVGIDYDTWHNNQHVSSYWCLLFLWMDARAFLKVFPLRWFLSPLLLMFSFGL